jgi:glutathione synthase
MKCGIIMDPIAHIKIAKDTSFAILLEAQARNHELYYFEPNDLWFQDGMSWGRSRRLRVQDNSEHWFDLGEFMDAPLAELDVIFMRKDPPFNMDYVYLTYLLEHAQSQGLFVINDPGALRDANEKLFTAWFPQCCPRTLIAMQREILLDFVEQVKEAVVKPLDKMGGQSIFRLTKHDPNLNVILETITENYSRLIVAQQFIPEIKAGDKRILMIDGESVPYALARKPTGGDFRGNLASGGVGIGQPLSDHDLWICEQVGPKLREKGLLFVGLDVIGDYLTEINVTSPTCARELDAQFNLNIAGQLLDVVEKKYLNEYV